MSKEYLGDLPWPIEERAVDSGSVNENSLIDVMFKGTPEDKARYIAREYDLEEELERELSNGAYRTSGDMESLVRKVYLESEMFEDEVVEEHPILNENSSNSIDDKVDYKPSKLRIVGNTLVDLGKKAKLDKWYYPFVGMLPGIWQDKIAAKLGHDPISYTKANMAFDTIVSTLVVGGIAFNKTQNISLAITVMGGTSILSGILNYGARRDFTREDWVLSPLYHRSIGSPLLFPLYLTAAVVAAPFYVLYKAGQGIGKIKEAAKESYQKSKEQENLRVELQQRIDDDTEADRENDALNEMSQSAGKPFKPKNFKRVTKG